MCWGVFNGIVYQLCQLWHLTLLSILSPEQSGISLTWKGNSSPLRIKHLLIFSLWQSEMRQLFILLQTQATEKKKKSKVKSASHSMLFRSSLNDEQRWVLCSNRLGSSEKSGVERVLIDYAGLLSKLRTPRPPRWEVTPNQEVMEPELQCRQTDIQE